MATLHTETVVGNDKKARWPYDSSLSAENLYNTIMTRVKQEKIGYNFEGWRYDGQIYKEPFNNESSNPFGPISANTTISAIWSKINVYCSSNKDTVSSQGEDVIISYYAVTTELINSNEVTLVVDTERTTANYQIISDTTSGSYRVCTIRINQNSSDDGKNLVVYAQYKGVRSDAVNIYQQSSSEFIIPDSDYFIFNYEWEYDDKGTITDTDDTGDGRDLDSLTVIYVQDREGNIVSKSFTGIPVGYRANLLSYASPQQSSVYKTQGGETLYFMKWGGDNRMSGAEGAIICFTNLANSGELSGTDKVIIEIYANWFSLRINGNMKINCKGYKAKDGSTGKYADEIIEVPHTNPKGNYTTFEPNPDNCFVSWDGFSDSLNIKANGTLNASYEDAFVPYLDKVYSKVCSVVFDVGSGNKTYKRRSVDNGRDSTGNYMKFKTDDNNKTSYYLNNQAQLFECGGMYVTYDNTDYYMYGHANDLLKVRVWVDNVHKTGEDITITSSELGQSFNGSFFSNLRFTKESNNKLKVSVNFSANPNNEKRNLDILMLKYIGDNVHPAIELPNHNQGFNIWQQEN